MFIHDEMLYRYNLSSPAHGGDANLTFKTPHDGEVEIHNYYINKDITKGPLEHFSIYSSGLVIYVKQTADNFDLYSNKEFELKDDGHFHLVSE